MKKKLWMLVCVCLLAFSVTACGKTDQTSITFNGGTYDQWKDTVQQTVQQITTVSEADIDNALSSISEKSDAVNYNFYSSWKEAVADFTAPLIFQNISMVCVPLLRVAK